MVPRPKTIILLDEILENERQLLDVFTHVWNTISKPSEFTKISEILSKKSSEFKNNALIPKMLML